MSEIFNEEINGNEKMNKEFIPDNFITKKVGFFGDNSSVNLIENSPKKMNTRNFNDFSEVSNFRFLKTNENSIFNKNNNESTRDNKEFKYSSNEITKFTNESTRTKNSQIKQNEINGFSKKINEHKINEEILMQVNPFENLFEEIEQKNSDFDCFKINKNSINENDNKEENLLLNENKFNSLNYFNFPKETNSDLTKNDKNDKKEFNNLVKSVTISSFSNIKDFNDKKNSTKIMNEDKQNNFISFENKLDQIMLIKKKSKLNYFFLISLGNTLTSEELLLEKIKREREEVKKLKENNMIYFEKTKNSEVVKQFPITPLTILKPFNLSSNYSKMLMKKRHISTNNDKINNKIKEVMRKKCEMQNMSKNIFIETRKVLNESPLQEKFNKMFNRSYSKSSEKKIYFTYETINADGIDNPFGKDYYNNNNLPLKENELKEISPMKNYEKEIKEMSNAKCKNGLNNFSEIKLNDNNSFTNNNNYQIEKLSDCNNNNLKKENEKQEEIKSFKKVIENSRQEKLLLEKKEKEIIKKDKKNQIKNSRFSNNNNMNNSYKNIERKSNLNKNVGAKKN